MRLTEAPFGVPLRLTTVGVGDPLRMRELGLRVGSLLEVVQRAGFGGRVLALGPTRIALDHVSCAALAVETAASDAPVAPVVPGASLPLPQSQSQPSSGSLPVPAASA